MDTPWAALSQHELSLELDGIERAIARSRTRTFHRSTDASGRTRIQLSPELLALTEDEHRIVTELRRRPPAVEV